jgi:prolipoprotein diacylglyceryltransferase
LYAPVRFGLDFLREADRTYGGFTAAHFSSIITLGLGVAVLWKAYRRPVKSLPPGLLASGRTATSQAVT